MELNKISIGIKTFLRDDKLFNTINAIDTNLPGAQMIIADDGYITAEKKVIYDGLVQFGHKVIHMPSFDAGFGAKSNAIAKALERPYLLIGSDDFDFSGPDVRLGIEQMLLAVERGYDIASGRVNNRRYEFDLEIKRVFKNSTMEMLGYKVQEIPIKPPEKVFYWKADLTVNYSLIRKRVFEVVHWDDDVKIGGGEHGAFFLDVKMAGFSSVWLPGVNINEQTGTDSELYKSFRNRAKNPRRLCFEKRNILEYILGNGAVDYKKE